MRICSPFAVISSRRTLPLSHSTNEELRKAVTAAIKHRKNVEVFFELYKKTILFDAPHFLIRIYFTLKSIVSRVNDFINPGARC